MNWWKPLVILQLRLHFAHEFFQFHGFAHVTSNLQFARHKSCSRLQFT